MSVVVTLVAVELARLAPAWTAAGADGRDAAHERLRGLVSWRLAPEISTDRGSLVRSVIKWIFHPFLPRSTSRINLLLGQFEGCGEPQP